MPTVPSPALLINGLTPPVDVGLGATISVSLANPAGANFWTLSVSSTDEVTSAGVYSPNLVINQTNKTAILNAPGGTLGVCAILQSQVGIKGLGLDANGILQSAYTTTAKVNVKTAGGLRVVAAGEIQEQSAVAGWVSPVNSAIRAAGGSTSLWTTAIDLDFTAQANQNFTFDASTSFAGYIWTKKNSGNETAHLANTLNTGLVFQPVAASGYSGDLEGAGANTRTLPSLWLPLSEIIPAAVLDFALSLRIWAYTSADNIVAGGGRGYVGVDDDLATPMGVVMGRGHGSTDWSSPTNGIAAWAVANGQKSGIGNFVAGGPTFGANNRVTVLELNLGSLASRVAAGAVGSVWPAFSALNAAAVGTPIMPASNGPILASEAATAFGVFLGAAGIGDTASCSVTYARLRVDYKAG